MNANIPQYNIYEYYKVYIDMTCKAKDNELYKQKS